MAIDDESLDTLLTDTNSEHTSDPAQLLVRGEIDGDLVAALNQLPSALLNPLLLRELEEMSYDQIAQLLDIPVGTVMSRLYRARRVVRERLSGKAKQVEVIKNELQ